MIELINRDEIANPYNLEMEVINHVVFILDNYLGKIRDLKIEDLNLRERLAYLGLIGELFPILDNGKLYLEISMDLLVSLRESIYRTEFRGLSLYDGLCNLAVFVEILNKNSGCYKKFLTSIDEIILKSTNDQITKLMKKETINFWDYDTISGLSGVGNYILCHDTGEIGIGILKKVAEYFVFLCDEVKEGDRIYPRWIGRGRNKEEIDDDYIDFSIAHGIAGPLAILTRLSDKGIIVDGQMEAIESIVCEYDSISNRVGCNIWPAKIPKNNYLDNHINVVNKREGWCYGSISVAKIFLEVARLMDNNLLYKKACKRIYEVSCMKIEELCLSTPILCHGYAGTAMIFRNLYNNSKTTAYLEQARRLLFKIIDSYSINSQFGFVQNDEVLLNGELIKRNCDKLDFLEGSSGIVMEMASWIKKESGFERMMLIK